MRKLQMLPPPEGPDLEIVREFDDDSATNLLTYQENGGSVCWKEVGKNTKTTPGYELSAAVSDQTPTEILATQAE